jgi:hypothetical protein
MKILLIRKFFFVSMCFLALSGCEYEFIEIPGPPDDDNLPAVSFSAEVAPIFSQNGCTNCHGGGTAPNLTAGQAYNSLVTLNLVVPGKPEESKIYTYPHPVSGTHNTKYKTIADANTIYAWIKNGAENN